METRIECEGFLNVLLVCACRLGRIEDQIPAMGGHRAWNDDELVLGQKRITERLLSCAWDSGPQPVDVGNVGRLNHMNARHVDDMKGGQDMWQRVERFEAFVNRDFEDRGRGIEGAIDDANTFAVPSAAELESAFATIPGRREARLIEAPGDEMAASQRHWQRCHA